VASCGAGPGRQAHGFEFDNLTKPNSGCHSGAVLFSAGFATAQDRCLDGCDLLTALATGRQVDGNVALVLARCRNCIQRACLCSLTPQS